MNRITRAWLLSLAIALSACGGGDGESTQDPSASSQDQGANPAPAPASSTVPAASLPVEKICGIANFQQDFLTQVNSARASGRNCGDTFHPAVAPLTWNGTLFDAAAAHALDMAANNYFSHESQDGRTFSQRISAAGYNWSTAGENIAAGHTSVEHVMAGWLESPGHCANIMNANFTEIGVACVRGSDASYPTYWVMNLGRPR